MGIYHPETGKNEAFVGNTKSGDVPQHLKGLKTARLGNQAYDIHGTKISPDYMRPLFIGHSEEAKYDEVMCKRSKS